MMGPLDHGRPADAAALVSGADDDDSSESAAPAWKQLHGAHNSADAERSMRIEGRADEISASQQEQAWIAAAAGNGAQNEMDAEKREGMETLAGKEEREEEKCPGELAAMTACMSATECGSWLKESVNPACA